MAESKGGGWIAVIAIGLAVAYCNGRGPATNAATTAATGSLASTESDEADGSLAESADTTSEETAADGEVRGGETYTQYDARRDALNTGLYSGGDECTEDCGGHDAGRTWAEQRGIDDPDDCGGNSWSFAEGCRSYAREQQGESAAGQEDEND